MPPLRPFFRASSVIATGVLATGAVVHLLGPHAEGPPTVPPAARETPRFEIWFPG